MVLTVSQIITPTIGVNPSKLTDSDNKPHLHLFNMLDGWWRNKDLATATMLQLVTDILDFLCHRGTSLQASTLEVAVHYLTLITCLVYSTSSINENEKIVICYTLKLRSFTNKFLHV